ncbi:DUF397 domain-containing protein [Sphaerisporangium aureirubrum]|uniref:DUF397 domain-containing protein n=1 Tax=Sphaerisporangium aureirubrum TaxID=1544736 RepID=A0ABW1NNW4_9ACTN
MDGSQITWRKSRYSGNGSNCLEVACVDPVPAGVSRKGNTPRVFLVRDSKVTHGPVLAVGKAGWEIFLKGVKGGRWGEAV